MPHLRIVSDAVWYRANEAIDARAPQFKRPQDKSSQRGVPRDSRKPLSDVLFCGMCGAKMHVETRYECSAAHNGDCWNKATANVDLTHERISEAVTAALLELRAAPERLLQPLRESLDDRDASRANRRS